MTTTVCVECSRTFTPRKGGKPQVTCSESCRQDRRTRQAKARQQTWRERLAERGMPPDTSDGASGPQERVIRVTQPIVASGSGPLLVQVGDHVLEVTIREVAR